MLLGVRSVGGSPMKSSNLKKPNELQRSQLSESNNELTARRSGLPASKLRQYSSHKELNRIPGKYSKFIYIICLFRNMFVYYMYF